MEHTKCGRKYYYSFTNAFKHYTPPCMHNFFFFKKTSFDIEEGRWILDLYITIVIYIIINSFVLVIQARRYYIHFSHSFSTLNKFHHLCLSWGFHILVVLGIPYLVSIKCASSFVDVEIFHSIYCAFWYVNLAT